MVRRITHIAVALMLIITTTGFTVSKHYCSGRVVKITINAEAESCCDMGSGCCHNDTEHFQLEKDYVSSVTGYDFQALSLDILFPVISSSLHIEPGKSLFSEIIYPDLPPPPKIQTLLSLLQTYLT